MSTKTISKRVALATVVALGAGVLSLVSVSSASAASFNGSTSANATASATNLNMATVSSTTGAAVLEGNNSGVSDGLGRSLGLLTYGDIAGTLTAGTTQTATLLSTGALSVYSTPTLSTNSAKIVVGAGGYISSAASKVVVNQSLNTAAVDAASVNTGIAAVVVKPTSGATSFTVSLYQDSAADTASSLLNGSNGGTLTLIGYITVTVASTSLSGTLSAAKSGAWYTGLKSAGTTTVISTALTADSSTLSSPGSIGNGGTGFINVRVRDAYGSAITGSGLLQATATNGALINWNGSAGTTTAPTAGSQSTAYVSVGSAVSADDYSLSVVQPASTPLNTVVTVTWNGTVIGTKSFSFGGQIAKVTLSSAVNGKTGDTTSGRNTAVVSFSDAAGNTVYPTAAYVSQVSTGFASIVTSAAITTTPADGVVGKVTFGCGANNGSAAIAVQYTNTDGTVIVSNSLPVTCSGDAVTYTTSYDKSNYKPGEIATLTITFKDSKGNLANDYTSPNATTAGVISASGLTALTSPAITANAAGTLTNGVLKYTYSVGTTTGTFTNSVTFVTTDNAAKALGLTASGPATATLTIADGATSLNDVLKGIVSLIASINKQIAALAKLVTKK